MDGFVFNVSEVPRYVHKSFSRSSAIEGGATIFSVTVETNALISDALGLGNTTFVLGGLYSIATPTGLHTKRAL